MDATDRAIIAATQAGLPLTPRPFDDLGKLLGLNADKIIDRMKAMIESGIIRRIAAVPNHYALGYTANGMTVWNVEDSMIAPLGQRVAALDCVSHCYHRPRHLPLWPYNLFAMVHGRTRGEVENKAATIADILGADCRGHEILYSTRILKKTGLRLSKA